MEKLGLPCCPFYKKEDGNKIYCELATFRCPDGESQAQVKACCCDMEKYKTCQLYQVLNDYWERRYRETEVLK